MVGLDLRPEVVQKDADWTGSLCKGHPEVSMGHGTVSSIVVLAWVSHSCSELGSLVWSVLHPSASALLVCMSELLCANPVRTQGLFWSAVPFMQSPMKKEVKFVTHAWHFCFLLLCFLLLWCEKTGVYAWGGVQICLAALFVHLIFQSFTRLCCCVFWPTWSQTTRSWRISFSWELADHHHGWVGELNGRTLTPQHLSGNSLCWVLSGWGLPQRRRWFLFAKGGRQEEEE